MAERDVVVYEVGPRDGLQNEAAVIGTAQKIAFVDAIERGQAAGHRSVGVREPEAGAADGRCGRSVRGHFATSGHAVCGPGPEPERARPRKGGWGDGRRDLRGGVRDVQPAQYQPVDRRVVCDVPRSRGSGARGRPQGPRLSFHGVRLSVRRRGTGGSRHRVDRASPDVRCVRSGRERHHRRRASWPGPRASSAISSGPYPRTVSPFTSTTPEAPRWPMYWPRSILASPPSTPPPAGSAAVPTHLVRPEISPPRTWSTCFLGSAWRPTSISWRSPPRHAPLNRRSGIDCRRDTCRVRRADLVPSGPQAYFTPDLFLSCAWGPTPMRAPASARYARLRAVLFPPNPRRATSTPDLAR